MLLFNLLTSGDVAMKYLSIGDGSGPKPKDPPETPPVPQKREEEDDDEMPAPKK